MSMEYIRKTYLVPAKRGMRVVYEGKEGVITGSYQGRIRIRMDGYKKSFNLHPTDGIEYLTEAVKE